MALRQHKSTLLYPILSVLAFTTLVVSGCSREKSTAPFVIQCNKDRLTLQELEWMAPGFSTLDSLQRNRLWENWISETLLAQEARNKLYDKDPYLKQRVKDFERRLLADWTLQQHLKQADVITEEEIREYYRKHIDSFRRAETEVDLLHVIVPTRREALRLLRILKSGNPKQRQQSLEIYPTEAGIYSLSQVMERARYKIQKSNQPGFYGPFRDNRGYHLIQVFNILPADSALPLEAVHEEIAQRIAILKKNQLKQALLDSLRQKATIIINPDYL